ncbi:circadian clock protein kaic [hydrocarbon metagenome]|jgi:KaiC domain protein|uniref:Circadian clock protein kaic n=1 Tax=hydrocarbon metagenome TaxID=938273 RepID=A0A0W8F1C6_9ZZZZ|nr:KaiC domain-containing protein [Methanoregulaceae archaeon]
MTDHRVRMGIDGLDGMLSGGLLAGSIGVLIGTYGTGKTTFALQFVHDGLVRGEKVIYISLEEREESLLAAIEQKGWDLSAYKDTSFFMIRLDPTDFKLAISSIKSELPSLIRSIGASRVVIDPISLFEGLFENEAVRRKEMFSFIEGMRDEPCTLLMTSEMDVNHPYASKYGIIEYLADTVIILRYIRPETSPEAHLALEVVKMRRSSHSREIKPFSITSDRVVVHSEATLF